MARKRKGELPSGNIRIQVYDFTDEKGKRHYKSFTAPTKAEAQMMAHEWKYNKDHPPALTVRDACQRYIELKTNVLSPSTIRGYTFVLNRIKDHRISIHAADSLTSSDMQLFISDMARSYSPKYVKNVYGFMTAAISMFCPDKAFHVTLPQNKRESRYIPDRVAVQTLLDAADTKEMKLAILFAAVGTMRRGEACAVEFKDVDYETNIIKVDKAFVETVDNIWELKPPKTYSSVREILMPKDVIDLIKSLGKKEGYVLGCNPSVLGARFERLLVKSGLPHFRFHDLRHYAASQMHAAGVPERYIEAVGGWKPGSGVLKRVYENVLDSEMKVNREAYLKLNKFDI